MEYIKNIAMFLIFISFIENVLAYESIKKYIRLFFGIILVCILLQPVSEILGEDFNIEKVLTTKEIELRMDKIDKEINEKMEELYEVGD